MNKITIIGRLTKSPTIKTSVTSQIKSCRFTLASKGKTRNENGEQNTDFFLCVAWRERADLIFKYCHKGDLIAVTGYMQNRTIEDDKGEQASLWECVVEDVEFLTSKAERERNGEGGEKVPDPTPPPEDEDNLPF